LRRGQTLPQLAACVLVEAVGAALSGQRSIAHGPPAAATVSATAAVNDHGDSTITSGGRETDPR